jgi:hypothetical protein
MNETKKEKMPISTKSPDSACGYSIHLTTKKLKEWDVGDLPIIIPIGYVGRDYKKILFTEPSKLK